MIKEVTIMGRGVKIKLVPKDELIKLMRELDEEHLDDSVLAFFDPLTCTINIWSGLEDEMFKRTLLHEMFHAMCSFSGMHQVLDKEENLEEALCDLSENWLEIFRNKKLVEELQ